MNNISYDKVKRLFHYKNGELIRNATTSHLAKIGDSAGTLSHKGYVQVCIDSKKYQRSRLVFLWHNGYMPENFIDHIDRDKSNDKIENLREVSTSCNLRNTGNFKHNTSGVKGINYYKNNKNWRSRIKVGGKDKTIGYYSEFGEAVLARLAAEQCLNWEGCDSSSPAYKYAVENGLIHLN